MSVARNLERRKSEEANEYGFTLIELLIVIVVLGILAAIVVFSLTGVTGQSKPAACTADAKTVEIAADAYQAPRTAHWPAALSDTDAVRTCRRCRVTQQRLHDQLRYDATVRYQVSWYGTAALSSTTPAGCPASRRTPR